MRSLRRTTCKVTINDTLCMSTLASSYTLQTNLAFACSLSAAAWSFQLYSESHSIAGTSTNHIRTLIVHECLYIAVLHGAGWAYVRSHYVSCIHDCGTAGKAGKKDSGTVGWNIPDSGTPYALDVHSAYAVLSPLRETLQCS